jgi:NMD protein affecting ribosome stability and mRNA decay
MNKKENSLFGMICEDCGTTENVSDETGLCADCEEELEQ